MPQVEKLLVFLASPGDVPTERRHVEEIVAELNRTVASDKGVILQVMSWEHDAFPGYGQDAQALINPQIAEMSKYALFVGIMWNRLGTQTPRAGSGTVEEFQRAVEALKRKGQPDIWFYFRQSASKLDTEDQLEQRKKVLAFKKEVQANGMPWTYKNPADFRDKFRNQMNLWLNARLLKRGTISRDTLRDIQGSGRDHEKPSNEPSRIDVQGYQEKAICLKAEAEFRIVMRQLNELPPSKEQRSKIDENISQDYSPFRVLHSSIDIRIEHYLLPLIKQRIQIESSLRATHRIPFTQARITVVKQQLRDLVKENWRDIVNSGYQDAVRHVVRHVGTLHEYKDIELRKDQERLLDVLPQGLFTMIDDILQSALADSLLVTRKLR